jgi:hypothetical protein
MDIHHKHGPLGNWRELAKEIGIIVVGVLIALGGEQAVEAIHHRAEVREVRESLQGEMSFNMASLKDVLEQVSCSTQRLDELERWSTSPQSGHPLRLVRLPDVPRFNIFRTAA